MTPLEPLLQRVTSRFGLTSRNNWNQEVEKAARILADRFGCEPLDLVHRAEMDPRILDVLVGHLTVGESYFYRHELHFELLASRLQESSQEIRKRGFRILSLGCSTGEEAYSAAITSREALGSAKAARVEILGCDLTRRSVEQATRAVYTYWSFRGAPEWLRERYFETAEDETWRLCDEIREQVQFEAMPIQTCLATLASGSVDAVFFRNVAIYLTSDSVGQIYPDICRVLRDNGLLFVAPADPRPTEGLVRIEHESASVYRKGRIVRRRFEPRALPLEPDRSRPKLRKAEAPKSPRPRTTRAEAILLATSPSREELLRNLLAHGDRGEMKRALMLADELVTASPSCPSGHLLRAKVQIAAGRELESLADLRRVTFLAPGHRVGRFWYAVALAHGGQTARADQQIKVLSKQLADLPETEGLEDGEVTAGELRRALEELEGSLR